MKLPEVQIKYPIFLKAATATDDDFWKYILTNLAYEKCPYGVMIEEPCLVCKFKGSEFNFNFTTVTDHVDMCNSIKSLLQSHLNIESTHDHLCRRQMLSEDLCYRGVAWSNIKKKSVKDILIENFVLHNKTKFNLSVKQSKATLSSIRLGFQFKRFSSADITYDADKMEIVCIRGIAFKDKKVIVPAADTSVAPHTLTAPPSSTDYDDAKVSLWELWEKYVSGLAIS